MSDKIKKSSLQEAKANLEEIQKFALEEAKKNLEQEVSEKVIELMNKSIEGGTLNEEVTINADGTTITVDDNGDVTVDAESEIEDVEGIEGAEDMEDVEAAEEPIELDSEIVVSDEDDEIEIDNSEIDEMNNLDEMSFEEQEMAAAAPAPEAAPIAPEAAPVEEMPTEAPMEEMPAEDAMANPFEMLAGKLDQLMSMMGGDAGAAGGEEIEIVDDTMGAAPAPVAEEITFEVVNNEMEVPEMDMEDDVLEIVGDMDEEPIEEVKMMGASHTVQRSTGDSAGPAKAKEDRVRFAMRENTENKAQYEAKLAELIKENEGLQSEKEELEGRLIKFENGFVKLQENFGQMQDYNAKLVMAYKVAMSGGLTTDEKVQISEQFDKCDTVEDAEKLYKSIVNEHKIKVNKNPEKSIKSNTVKAVHAKSVSQPLYESKEVSRMKQLAGIKNLNG
jgi:hypothetical protein